MKTTRFTLRNLAAGFAIALALASCQNNESINPQKDLLPQSFSVDIPPSISSNAAGGRIGGRVQTDTLQGNEIYRNLGTFINVGKNASKIVEGFINGVRKYRIDKIQSLTYTSDEDGRAKNLIVKSKVDFEGTTWDYQLTVTDAADESQADGGKAMQLFWNTDIVKGIAIIKPYNSDRNKNSKVPDALFKVTYTEGGSLGYEKQMEVFISGVPLGNPITEPYSINTVHMFAGKKGNVIDVVGNSNHPNASFFTTDKGFNWAFVASGNELFDIGVAEVGLPSSSLDNSDRNVLLKDNSIKNVFTKAINTIWPGIDQTQVAAYLKNTAAPGYFSKNGFMRGGTSPGTEWDALAARLGALSPYNPLQTSNLVVKFK
ncbi:hypothetical protein BH10BAC4_BH10BAC4_11040 [soil metagenome]